MTTKNIQDVVAEKVEEWREKFTYKREPGNTELAHFLVNDDGYEEPYSGGDTNEVHQHVKWLNTTLTQLVKEERERIVEELMRLVEGERMKHQTWDFGPDGPPSDFPSVDVLEMDAVINGNNKAIDTIKQHITNVTGVE